MAHLEDVVTAHELTLQQPGRLIEPKLDLPSLWSSLTSGAGEAEDEATSRREGLIAFMEAAHALDQGSGEELDLRAGGWTVDLSGGVVRTGLCAALLTGVLAMAGVTALAPVVLPAVLPLLFDVRRTRVTAGDRELLAELIAVPRLVGKSFTRAELYRELPDSLKDDLSRRDLANFLDELSKAGLADKVDGAFRLRSPDQARFRISWS